MKKTILFLMMFFGVFANNAQEKLSYSDVVQIEGVSKDDLFNRSVVALTTTYNDVKNVTQQQDKDNGQVIVKALFDYESKVWMGHGMTNGIVKYTLFIYVRDGRYKYEITDFVHEPDAGNSFYDGNSSLLTVSETYPFETKKMETKWKNNVWKDLKEQTENKMNVLIEVLENKMKTPIETENDDW